MNKKAIAILGAIFLLIVITLGFLIFSKYVGKKSPVASNPGALTTASTSPTNANGANAASTTPLTGTPASGVIQLSTDQVVSPALFFNGQGITYFDNQGNLYQASLQDNNGQLQLADKKQLNIPIKSNITNILWPAKGNDFIARFTNSSGQPAYSYFNSTTQTYTDLPSQVQSVDWMPSGTQIMYIWWQNNKGTLKIGNPDATNYQNLAAVYKNDDEVHVSPDGSQLLIFENNNPATDNPINSVTTDGKIWKTLVSDGQNFGVLWSPDGQKFLFGKKDLNTQAYQLWVYNLTSGELVNLGLFTTPSKAVWASDSNTVYAAVPSSAPAAGSNSLTADTFFSIDTTTLGKTQYNSGITAPIDAIDLLLNSTGDKLIFKNAQDGGLYYLNLKQ
jgi:hypothetical protein